MIVLSNARRTRYRGYGDRKQRRKDRPDGGRELAEIGGDTADRAVGEINGEAAGCVEAAAVR